MAAHRPERFDTAAHRRRVPGTLERDVRASPAGGLPHGGREIAALDVDDSESAKPPRRLQPFTIRGRASHDRPDPFRNEQLQAQQPHGSGARDDGGLSWVHAADFDHRLDDRGEGFAQGALLQSHRVGDAIELIGPRGHVTGKSAVDAVAHASPAWTEDEVAAAAVFAFAARHRRGAEHRDTLANRHTTSERPGFNDRTGQFMAEDHRRIVAKRVVQHMKISAADTTKRDLDLDFIVAANRLRNFADLDVAVPGCVFDECFHQLRGEIGARRQHRSRRGGGPTCSSNTSRLPSGWHQLCWFCAVWLAFARDVPNAGRDGSSRHSRRPSGPTASASTVVTRGTMMRHRIHRSQSCRRKHV